MWLKKLCFTIIMLISLSVAAQKKTSAYIKNFLPIATKLQEQWGIPVSIILGVSILESGSGTSRNAKHLNNYFGITGRNKLKSRRSVYKQYANSEDSFEDFCKILSGKKFYKKIKNDMNYHAWLTAMIKANYASAKGIWISRIKNIIQKQKLSQYDKLKSNNEL